MKFSLALSFLILAVGGAMGLMQQKRLSSLRSEQTGMVEKAERLGISVAALDLPQDRRSGGRARTEISKEAAGLATELASLARDLEAIEKSGKSPDDSFQDRALELMGKMTALGGGQLKGVISSLLDDKSLSEESRKNMIGFSILMLSEDHPAAAVDLFAQSHELLGSGVMSQHVIINSLSRWAQENPKAAIDWLKKNAADHPDFADDVAKQGVIDGAAKKDPKLAFQLIGELGFEDPSDAIRSLVESGKTAEQRTSILAALREHLTTLQDESGRSEQLDESLEDMGRNISNEGFDSVSSWLEKESLSPEEKAKFVGGLSYFNTKQDTGRWIDWMSRSLPEDELKENVENLVGQWTQQDYMAAGKWLSNSPEGSAKNAAVSTYAETVAEYEPQTAVQWAMTMPSGAQRQATLEAIYRNWPKSDVQAAEAFAKQHGVDPEKAREEP